MSDPTSTMYFLNMYCDLSNKILFKKSTEKRGHLNRMTPMANVTEALGPICVPLGTCTHDSIGFQQHIYLSVHIISSFWLLRYVCLKHAILSSLSIVGYKFFVLVVTYMSFK